MSKSILPFIIFVILFFYALPFPIEATAVVPGWQTNIRVPWNILVKAIAIIIMLVTAAWFYLSKKAKVNLTIFAIHLLTTAPIVLYTKQPFRFAATGIMLPTVFLLLFIAGQILFGYYAIKATRFKKESIR